MKKVEFCLESLSSIIGIQLDIYSELIEALEDGKIVPYKLAEELLGKNYNDEIKKFEKFIESTGYFITHDKKEQYFFLEYRSSRNSLETEVITEVRALQAIVQVLLENHEEVLGDHKTRLEEVNFDRSWIGDLSYTTQDFINEVLKILGDIFKGDFRLIRSGVQESKKNRRKPSKRRALGPDLGLDLGSVLGGDGEDKNNVNVPDAIAAYSGKTLNHDTFVNFFEDNFSIDVEIDDERLVFKVLGREIQIHPYLRDSGYDNFGFEKIGDNEYIIEPGDNYSQREEEVLLDRYSGRDITIEELQDAIIFRRGNGDFFESHREEFNKGRIIFIDKGYTNKSSEDQVGYIKIRDGIARLNVVKNLGVFQDNGVSGSDSNTGTKEIIIPGGLDELSSMVERVFSIYSHNEGVPIPKDILCSSATGVEAKSLAGVHNGIRTSDLLLDGMIIRELSRNPSFYIYCLSEDFDGIKAKFKSRELIYGEKMDTDRIGGKKETRTGWEDFLANTPSIIEEIFHENFGEDIDFVAIGYSLSQISNVIKILNTKFEVSSSPYRIVSESEGTYRIEYDSKREAPEEVKSYLHLFKKGTNAYKWYEYFYNDGNTVELSKKQSGINDTNSGKTIRLMNEKLQNNKPGQKIVMIRRGVYKLIQEGGKSTDNTSDNGSEGSDRLPDITGEKFRISHLRASQIAGENRKWMNLEKRKVKGVELTDDEFVFCLLCAEDQEVGIHQDDLNEEFILGEKKQTWPSIIALKNVIIDKVGNEKIKFTMPSANSIILSEKNLAKVARKFLDFMKQKRGQIVSQDEIIKHLKGEIGTEEQLKGVYRLAKAEDKGNTLLKRLGARNDWEEFFYGTDEELAQAKTERDNGGSGSGGGPEDMGGELEDKKDLLSIGSVERAWYEYLFRNKGKQTLLRGCGLNISTFKSAQANINDILQENNVPQRFRLVKGGIGILEYFDWSKVIKVVISDDEKKRVISENPHIEFDWDFGLINANKLGEGGFNLFLVCLLNKGRKLSIVDVCRLLGLPKDACANPQIHERVLGIRGTVNDKNGRSNPDLLISKDKDANLWIGKIEKSKKNTNPKGNELQNEISRIETLILEQEYDFGSEVDPEACGVELSQKPNVGFIVCDRISEVEFSDIEYIFFTFLLSKNGQLFSISDLKKELLNDEEDVLDGAFSRFYDKIKKSINQKLKAEELDNIFSIKSPENKESIPPILEHYEKSGCLFQYNKVTKELIWGKKSVVIDNDEMLGYILRFFRCRNDTLLIRFGRARRREDFSGKVIEVNEYFQNKGLPFEISFSRHIRVKIN